MGFGGTLPAGLRYLRDRRIGSGGYSQVWRAWDTVLDRPVAIKELHPGYAEYSEAVTRLAAEARHAGSLSHENIARIYDYCVPAPPRLPYMVMELVDGPSLAEMLATNGPLRAAHAMDVVAQAAAGLDAAHRAGLIHRDVKPGNVLISPGGRVKITDFGISHAVGSGPVTRSGVITGTWGYLAPEQAAGGPATPASDLYSLGIVAYECLTGARPFTGGALEQALAHQLQPLPDLPPSVPANVAAFVMQLTAKDPAMRPPSAAAAASHARQLRDMATAAIVVPTDGGVEVYGAIEHADRRLGIVGAGPASHSTRELSSANARDSQSSLHRKGVAAVCVAVGLAGLILAGFTLLAPQRSTQALQPPNSSRSAGTARPKTSTSPRPPSRSADRGSPGSAAPSRPKPATAAPAVMVNAASLVGQPVAAAAQELSQAGLAVRVRWVRGSAQRPGLIVAVQPGGQLSRGSVVTITGAQQLVTGQVSQDRSAQDGSGQDGGRGHHLGHDHGHGAGDQAGHGWAGGDGNSQGDGHGGD